MLAECECAEQVRNVMNRPIKFAIFLVIMAAEVLLFDGTSKAQNQPLSFDVVGVVSSIAFAFNYFHVPVLLSVLLAILCLAIPAALITLLIGWLYGLWSKVWQKRQPPP